MKLYEHKEYQDIIKAYVLEQKALGNKVTYQSLAESIRVQKSYFSKVMNKDASLSRDQIYLLTKQMGLNTEEEAYLFLLLDYEKCAIEERKVELKERINLISLQKTQSANYLNKNKIKLNTDQMNEYYLYPETQLVHLALSIPKFQKNLELLKNTLSISDDLFSKIIKLLEELELIEIGTSVKLLKSNLHLSKDSPYFHSWRTNLSLKGLEWCKGIKEKDKYNFTVSFTADEETKEEIRLGFLNYLKTIEKAVSKAPSKKLYQMNFDLFKWL